MLTVNHLSVSYGDKKVLDDLNIVFEQDCIHGLVGLNGSGKTTLLNVLYGLKRSDSGEILYNNRVLKRTDITFLETENYYYSRITGREYLSLFPAREEYRPDEWNELFHLPLDQLIDSYSTGMKKKLSVMAALKEDKEILLLDEPFNGLDIEASKVLSMIIARLKSKGRTIIITSHILESLTNICDYIHYLNDQRIGFKKDKSQFPGISKDIFRDMEDAYLKTIDRLME